MRYQYDLGLSEEEIEKLEETEYRNLGTEESQMYCGCRKRMKKNRTSWSDDGAEAMVKVISYMKSNLLDDLITGRMEKAIQEELGERIEEPKKVKKKKLGKVKYATKNSILESLTGFRKQKVIELLRTIIELLRNIDFNPELVIDGYRLNKVLEKTKNKKKFATNGG